MMKIKEKELRIKLSRLESKVHRLHLDITDLIRQIDTNKDQNDRHRNL